MRLNNCCKFTNHDYLLSDMYKNCVVMIIVSIIIIISLFKLLQIVYFNYVFANYYVIKPHAYPDSSYLLVTYLKPVSHSNSPVYGQTWTNVYFQNCSCESKQADLISRNQQAVICEHGNFSNSLYLRDSFYVPGKKRIIKFPVYMTKL